MATPCRACPLRKCPGFQPLTEPELAFQERLKTGERVVRRGTTILTEGETSLHLYTVLSGLGIRYLHLPDGQRQVINFVFPGDFLGLQAGVMDEMKHSVAASSDMVLCTFNRSDLFRLFHDHPQRAYDLTWLCAAEEHFLGQALATVGQREALEGMAWALARCLQRGRDTGLTRDWQMDFPFRQRDLADALGLSLVHTNKTLARMRAAGLAEWSRGRLIAHDPEALFALAGLEIDGEARRPLF